MRRRPPAQAGKFYPATERAVRTKIQESFLHPLGPGRIPPKGTTMNDRTVGLIVPHAGYDYSGPVAAHGYYALGLSGVNHSAIILGPNHTGLGTGVSTMVEGEWSTPLGDVPVDTELAKRIIDESGLIDVDETAHKYEHSIEVQLPFLQFLYPAKFSFVPICMMLQDLQTSLEIGRAVAKAAKQHRAVVIASSDWTHYEPQEEAVMKDKEALQAAIQMDERKFQKVIEEKGVSACGYGPVTALIQAAKILGATKPRLLSHQTSGDITGDTGAVVGYAAATFEKTNE
ncbi:MAG TPA: AmmeMemoRadiSam system protein B [Candidatus Bathyarchaeia archaeon]|nr:AmmeMemoRadiSam system protein B [Candidatus Bathyarchaeia archaeon]